MSPRDALRWLVGRLPAWLVIGLAAAGFFVLSRGMTLGAGTIAGYAEQQVHSVGPLLAGRLKAVPVRLGQSVKAGDIVAQLDTRQLELQRERLLAELAQAKATLVAERDVQGSLLQRSQTRAVSTYADEKRLQAELRELTTQVNRLEWLRTRQLVRQSELEEAKRRLSAVTADLQARPSGTPRELELWDRRPRDKDEQEQRLDERLAPYRAAVAVSEKAIAELDNTIFGLTLRAPVDGTVGAILQRAGDALAAGAPVVSIVVARPGHIVAYVPERQMKGLSIGTPVQVRRPGLFTSAQQGRVVELSPGVEEFPPRARHSPAVPVWGRRVIIQLDEVAAMLPGETFHISSR